MKVSKIQKSILLVVLYATLPAILLLTNPQDLPIVLLVLPIISVFAICVVTAHLVLGVLRPNMKQTKKRVIAICSAILPTVLVILQSIQQMSVRDVFITLGLWLLLVWYLQRIDFV